MAFKTVRRDWLKRQVEAGKVEVKCNFSLTDDYAFDNATGFGKTDWLPAHIRHPKFEKRTNYVGNTIDVCVDDDRKEGFYNLMECDFTGKSGACYWTEDGTIRLSPYSNLSYTFRIKQN